MRSYLLYEANTSAWMTSVVLKNGCGSGMQVSCEVKERQYSLSTIARPILMSKACSQSSLSSSCPTPSEIQPCDQGTLTVHYRKNMVKHLICAINNGSTVVDFKITLLDGLQMLRKAWESVTESIVSNCFCKARFILPLEPEVEEEDPFLNLDEENTSQDAPLLQLETCTFDDYVAVDDELQCAPLPTTEDIVSSVRQTSEEADENDDAGDPLPFIT